MIRVTRRHEPIDCTCSQRFPVTPVFTYVRDSSNEYIVCMLRNNNELESVRIVCVSVWNAEFSISRKTMTGTQLRARFFDRAGHPPK